MRYPYRSARPTTKAVNGIAMPQNKLLWYSMSRMSAVFMPKKLVRNDLESDGGLLV